MIHSPSAAAVSEIGLLLLGQQCEQQNGASRHGVNVSGVKAGGFLGVGKVGIKQQRPLRATCAFGKREKDAVMMAVHDDEYRRFFPALLYSCCLGTAID